MKKVLQAAALFTGRGETVVGAEKYGQGIIHATYLVTLSTGRRFILQRINTHVFKDPAAITHNLKLVSGHIQKRLYTCKETVGEDWQMLQGIATENGHDFFAEGDDSFWRALSFIEGAVPLEEITGTADAFEVGRALGVFHRLTSDLSPGLLKDTLPGFHNIEQYLAHYDAVEDRVAEQGNTDAFCRKFIADRRAWATVLENGRRTGVLKNRVIHGDPKINNIMVSNQTGRAVSLIDLDTLMPGLVHYDIGDCLRSCCNTAPEDATDLSAVEFNLGVCKAALTGYAAAAGNILTDSDVVFLYDAIRLIPFELGLRFYTDLLEGNVYFKTGRPDQNLARAMVQFRLVESVEQQEEEIRRIIKACFAEGIHTSA